MQTYENCFQLLNGDSKNLKCLMRIPVAFEKTHIPAQTARPNKTFNHQRMRKQDHKINLTSCITINSPLGEILEEKFYPKDVSYTHKSTGNNNKAEKNKQYKGNKYTHTHHYHYYHHHQQQNKWNKTRNNSHWSWISLSINESNSPIRGHKVEEWK